MPFLPPNQQRQSTEGLNTGVATHYINLYLPKNGCSTKTQQRKHKYKQSENNDPVHHSS